MSTHCKRYTEDEGQSSQLTHLVDALALLSNEVGVEQQLRSPEPGTPNLPSRQTFQVMTQESLLH